MNHPHAECRSGSRLKGLGQREKTQDAPTWNVSAPTAPEIGCKVEKSVNGPQSFLENAKIQGGASLSYLGRAILQRRGKQMNAASYRESILRILSDGQPHTAVEIALALGIRSARVRRQLYYLRDELKLSITSGRRGFQMKVGQEAAAGQATSATA